MPRQTRRSAPAQQTRKAHTMPARQAPPPRQQQPAQQQQHAMTSSPAAAPPVAHQPAPQQPGLFGQMASTAAGVAVGSAVGHTMANGVSSLFGGSGSSEPVEQQQQQPQYQQQAYQQPATQGGVSCEADAKAFTKCLEANGSDISACQWYLDNLKACQSMASHY